MTEKVIRKMLESKIIQKEDYEIYQYGIKNGVMILIDFLTVFMIGLLTSKLVQLLLFNLVFMTIRSYSGGFHSDSKVICYSISSLMQGIPVITEIWFYKSDVKIIIAVMILAVCIIYSFCPMDSKNRKLDEDEKMYYRKLSKRNTAIWIIVFGLLYLRKEMSLCNAVFDGMAGIAVSMIIGIMVLKWQKNHNTDLEKS